MLMAKKLVTDQVSQGSTKRKPAILSDREYLAAEDDRVDIYHARAVQTGCRNPKLALATGLTVWPTSRLLSKGLAYVPRHSNCVEASVQVDRLDGHVLRQMSLT